MTRTRGKLNEAQFFLQKLEKNVDTGPDFDYYLSAFLSSARSVLWVMRSEYLSVDSWEDWYKSTPITSEQDTLLKVMRELRNRTVKRETIDTKAQVILQVKAEHVTHDLETYFAEFAGRRAKITLEVVSKSDTHQTEFAEHSASFLATMSDFIRVVQEFPEEDILVLCKRYFEWLSAIVTECESRFVVDA